MSKPLACLAAVLLAFPFAALAAPPDATEQDLFREEAAAMRAEIAGKAAPLPPGGADTDSFGRTVKWDGLMQSGIVTLLDDCTPQPGDPPPGPDDRCLTLNAAPAATSFDFADIGRLTIPGKAVNSLLCHWLSPLYFYSFANGTGVQQPNGRFQVTPYVVVESNELSDPTLINPVTGLPFNGQLETGFSASYFDRQSLVPGETEAHRLSFTRTCIAGFLTKKSLVEVYGLTPAKANAVFQKDMTLRFGVRGSAALISNGSILYGLRVVGD